jgi:predicted nucleic acid-binding protein
MIYALDTSTVTFLLKENENVKLNADISLDKGHTLILPRIVDYEVQRGLLAKRMDKKLREYLAFRNAISIGAISEEVWDKATHLYAVLSQKGTPIGDGDTIIAAFCLVNDCTLVTNDTDFFYVDGLKIVNWISNL